MPEDNGARPSKSAEAEEGYASVHAMVEAVTNDTATDYLEDTRR